jgi:hypothetical protein
LLQALISPSLTMPMPTTSVPASIPQERARFRSTTRHLIINCGGLKRGEPDLKVRLPVTVGCANFETFDIVDGKFPEKTQTLTFVPGIGISYRINENWTLSPFVDFGIGYDFENSNSSYVFGTALRSLATFDFQSYQLELFNALLYAGNTLQPDEAVNDFSRLETGLNFQFPLDRVVWNRKTAVSAYYLNYVYFNRLEFVDYLQEPVEVSLQHEVGLTFDTFPDMKVLGIPFSRIGLGIRIGNKGEAIRLVFGTPY